MREYELEVLQRYDVEVKGTRRIRGAFFCDTSEGDMLLKETGISDRRAALLYIVLSRLELERSVKADTPVFTKDGELLAASRDGTRYMMKKWYSGRECDVKKESEIIAASGNLARLHNVLRWEETGTDRPPAGRDPVEELARHNREMKKVRSFIRARVAKNEFEYLYLESFEKMYALAVRVLERMEGSGCMDLYGKSVRSGRMLHGDYNYHNLIMLSGGMAVTNFEHLRIGIQAQDLYYFIRKAMEKCHWKQKLGREMLEAYQSVRKIEPVEKEYIGLCLAYPEKFWKAASSYARSNKAWLPEKSVEKLQTAVHQTEEKEAFLENVFSLDLYRSGR